MTECSRDGDERVDAPPDGVGAVALPEDHAVWGLATCPVHAEGLGHPAPQGGQEQAGRGGLFAGAAEIAEQRRERQYPRPPRKT